MKGLGSGALACGVVAIAAAALGDTACKSTQPTELVPGVMTQVNVPRDVQAIRIEVLANGATKFCQVYQVYDGAVKLPGTLGVISGISPETTIEVTVRGYDQPGASGSDITDCGQHAAVDAPQASGQGPGPRVLRRTIQTFVDQHTLFLPMPLSYSCWDQPDCGEGSTCKGSRCYDAHIDPSSLADFDPALYDGKSGPCFDTNVCFADALPASNIDATNCTYTFPVQPFGTGMNVRIFYTDVDWVKDTLSGQYLQQLHSAGEQEVLNVNDQEGFTQIDATHFKLADSLCDLAKNATTPPPDPSKGGKPTYRTISDVQIASTCPPKQLLLPICVGEQNAPQNLPDGGSSTDGKCNVAQSLVPAPSALYIVMDNDNRMGGALGLQAAQQVLSLSLDNPVFKRTYVAFSFFSHDSNDCGAATTKLATPTIAFDLAKTNQKPISDAVGQNPLSSDPPYELEAEMTAGGAYKALTDFKTSAKLQFNHLVAMFFLNSEPNDANQCLPAKLLALEESNLATAAGSAFTGSAIETQFVVLGSNDGNATANATWADFGNVVSQAPAGAVSMIDVRSSDKQADLLNFAPVIESLGTCLYELPKGVDKTATLGFYNPLLLATQPIASWTIEPVPGGGQRIRLSANDCSNLKSAIAQASAAALQLKQKAPDLPVTATMPCK